MPPRRIARYSDVVLRPLALLLAALSLTAPWAAWAETNDPYAVLQWGLHAVEAEAAWQATKGAGIVVAVVDTGVDPRHPDLKKRLLDGRDLADDDLDSSDDNGHGTLVAGIIAASTSNGVGVASVAPAARILPVRVLGADGTGSSEDVAEGIRWAIDEGADVINLSLAQDAGEGMVARNLLRDPSVDRAIEDAASAGATVVIAAGNDHEGGRAETSYDASVPGVVVVGATTKKDRRAAYSHYGRGLDMVAPGGGSASDPSDDGCTERNSIVSTWWNPERERSDYGGGCGTSMAVGFVSGAAALLHARGMSNAQVVDRLLATADDLGAQGRDQFYGTGRLNVRRALGVAAEAAVDEGLPPSDPPARAREESSTVRSQAGAGKAEEPRATPSVGQRPTYPDLPLALDPIARDGRRDAWSVPLAAALVLLVTAAHAMRLVASGANALADRASERRAEERHYQTEAHDDPDAEDHAERRDP